MGARPCLSSSKPSSPSASRPIPHRATPPHLRAACSFNTPPQPSPSRPPMPLVLKALFALCVAPNSSSRPPVLLATHIPSRHASQCSCHLPVQPPPPTITISPAC